MTHEHQQDYELCQAILRRNDSAFLALIDSKTKAARFRHRLRDAQIPDIAIEHLTCPVGLTDITDKQPTAIAISIAAQLLRLWQETPHGSNPH